jgi:hypothetical protein
MHAFGQEGVSPSPNADAVKIEGGKVLVRGGLVSFDIPAGWKNDRGPDGKFIVISGRSASASNSYPSAGCRVLAQQGRVPDSLTQADANARALALDSRVAAQARENKTLRVYSKDQRIGDVAVIRIVIADPTDAYSDNRQFVVVQGGEMIAVHADCNTSFPEKADDRRDMEAFLGSVAIKRPF